MWILLLPLLIFSSLAETNGIRENAFRMVRGEISREFHAYQIKTPKGSIVQVVFDVSGAFFRAEGNDVEKDELFIGKLGLSLSEALKLAKKKNLKPSEWWIEEENGKWYYTFRETRGACDEIEVKVDALKGKLVE